VILVRHAKSVVDPTTPPAEWALADGAREAAAALGRHLHGTRVIASTEAKAIATGEALGLGPVVTSADLCEVARPWYDDADALTRDAQRWFGGDDVDGWETFADAVARFGRALDGQSVVVTHGTVMTAWIAAQELVKDPFAFWRDLRMPDAWEVGRTLERCPVS
jgi:broad specificity phosphatase PhoE